jgi:hypothetical protein
MADETQKLALLRLFRLADEVRREGLKLDGTDPAWKALCDDPNLQSMGDEEIKSRLREIVEVVSDDNAESSGKSARFKSAMGAAARGMIEAVERGDVGAVLGAAVVNDAGAVVAGQDSDVQDETEKPAA